MVVTNEGQISVDFLLGISIFLLTFGFVIQFIPGLFISAPGGGSLNSVVYRTANILADDPGWWQNNTQNGTDWEIHTGNISRIGLAADATPRTRQTRTPRMLNKTKIEQAQNLYISNKTKFTTDLGLYYKISGSQINYGYNITIEPIGNPMTINGSNGYIPFGDPHPPSQDIYKITRLVLVERGNISSFRAEELNGSSSNKVIINISGPQSEDVIIQITDFNITDTNDANFTEAKPSNYSALKRINNSEFFTYSYPLNRTDTLRLIFNSTQFLNPTNQLELNFTGMNFTQTGPPIEYTSKIEPLYEPATLVVEAWS